MRDSAQAAWFMALFWAAWVCAGQSFLAGAMGIGASSVWAPDLALVLLFSWCARFDPSTVPRAVAVVCIARLAFSIEPAVAVLCGLLALGALGYGLRAVCEVASPILRTLLAGGGAFAFAGWLIFVHRVRGGDAASSLDIWSAIPTAVSTGLCAFGLGPLFANLPGLPMLAEDPF